MALTIQKNPSFIIRIFLVDDHPVVLFGLNAFLSRQEGFEICGMTHSRDETLNQLVLHKPDVMLVDLKLHESSGLDLIREIREIHPQVKILVYSTYEDSTHIEKALRAGALGFVNKQEEPKVLIDGIRRILQGKVFLASSDAERVLQRLASSEDSKYTAAENLSEREMQVFELLGQGLRTREIAEKLNLSPKTIETYRGHIKTKLKIDNSAELLREAVLWLEERRKEQEII